MWSVPSNVRGYQDAYDGESYCGLAVWASSLVNGREFIGVPLNDSLEAGHKYQFKMTVSLTDSSRYAVNSIGAFLSSTQPIDDLATLLAIEPQISIPSSTFLVDTSGWTEVQGAFVAQGGEAYVTIGNFNDDQATDTLLVDLSGQSSSAWNISGYYLDDVSLVEDTTYHVGIQENNFQFSIYPNPATDNLRIESQTPLVQVKLTDLAGRTSVQQTFRQAQGDISIDVTSLPSGIYLLEAFTQDGRRSVQKVVVE